VVCAAAEGYEAFAGGDMGVPDDEAWDDRNLADEDGTGKYW